MSYDPDIPAASMRIEQFISDSLAVTNHLRQRFGQDKIYLLGHSWCSFIAVQAAARSPQRYDAYLGMGQMVFQLKSEKLAYDHMLVTRRCLWRGRSFSQSFGLWEQVIQVDLPASWAGTGRRTCDSGSMSRS